eukprot:32245_2
MCASQTTEELSLAQKQIPVLRHASAMQHSPAEPQAPVSGATLIAIPQRALAAPEATHPATKTPEKCQFQRQQWGCRQYRVNEAVQKTAMLTARVTSDWMVHDQHAHCHRRRQIRKNAKFGECTGLATEQYHQPPRPPGWCHQCGSHPFLQSNSRRKHNSASTQSEMTSSANEQMKFQGDMNKSSSQKSTQNIRN